MSFGAAALFVLAASCRVGWADSTTTVAAGSALPVAAGAQLSLLDCPSGRQMASLTIDWPIRELRPVVSSGTAIDALVVLAADGVVSVHDLPSLRERARREGMPANGMLVTAGIPAGAGRPAQSLVAIGGRRTAVSEPLRMLDAATLDDLHRYRLEPSVEVMALAAVPGRNSLLAGVAQADAPTEVWEIALSPEAPPVLKGLVHDYRMGEAVALPGQYTPRPAPVGSATAGLAAGPVPYEWLRVAADGRVTVLHLEVRREIARLPEAPGGWLAAPWRGAAPGAGRGWIVGEAGGTTLRRFDSVSWRLSPPQPLPGELLALAEGFEPGAVVAAIREAGAALHARAGAPGETGEATGRLSIGTVDPAGPGFQPRVEVTTPVRGGVHLLHSIDRQCLALVDSQGRWLGALGAR